MNTTPKLLLCLALAVSACSDDPETSKDGVVGDATSADATADDVAQTTQLTDATTPNETHDSTPTTATDSTAPPIDADVITPLGSCEVGAPGSIAATCINQNRVCVPPSGNTPAACGDCIAGGYVPVAGADYCELEQECRPDHSCLASSRKCVQIGIGDEPTCRAAPCDSGDAWNRATQSCKSCAPCTGPGTTGVLWPVTDESGACVCETQTGWFWDSSVAANDAYECDHDGDGWTTAKVAQINAQASPGPGDAGDWTLLLNTRCTAREIKTFTLENSYGQQKVLTLASLGVAAPALALYETQRNDRGDATHPMPSDGRPFRPEEANSLTKVCAGGIDLNDNGISDTVEAQDYVGGETFQAVTNRLGYFAEMYQGTLVGDTFIIKERERCAGAGFAPTYDSTVDPYWRSCARRRPSTYKQPGGPGQLGFDFARFDCDAPSGSCGLDLPVDPPAANGNEPLHSTCDAPALDEDVEWLGMTQYSQFSCVTVKTTPQSATELARSSIHTTGNSSGWHVSRCLLGTNPGTFECTAVTSASAADQALDQVVWAGREYKDYGSEASYAGGCINEWVEWPELCPGYVGAPESVFGKGDPLQFGELDCTCGTGFELVGNQCKDIDECARHEDDCDDVAQNCVNLVPTAGQPERYRCDCALGYEPNGAGGCKDIDECATQKDDCWGDTPGEQPPAECVNLAGTYECHCWPGFGGNGHTCDTLPTVDLYAHYKMDGYPPGSAMLDASPAQHHGTVILPFAGEDQPRFYTIDDRFGQSSRAWRFSYGGEGVMNYATANGPVGDSYSVAMWLQVTTNYSEVVWQTHEDEEEVGGLFYDGDGSGPDYGLYFTYDREGVRHGDEPDVWTPLDDGWNFIVLTYDGNSGLMRLYRNGSLVPTDGSHRGEITQFGSRAGGTQLGQWRPQDTNGSVAYDDVRFYTLTLGLEGVDALYHEGGF